nr:MAG TPA: hypothetical protein [Caudoviricetes sp.]
MVVIVSSYCRISFIEANQSPFRILIWSGFVFSDKIPIFVVRYIFLLEKGNLDR